MFNCCFILIIKRPLFVEAFLRKLSLPYSYFIALMLLAF
ncbi:hypothetical protein MGSAQ_000450 [marine sediment metagenome]|uniref:Uncharacterized protein n=1 Tax=marine sediment metagenome TaxID=412755 RepID=A0A1B6NX82_9ZZZZ